MERPAGVQKLTAKKAYAHFGAVKKDSRRSWSAVCSDGKTVVLALWEDCFSNTEPDVYGTTPTNPATPRSFWERKWGNKERVRHLKLARDKSEGRFRVIIAVPKNPHEQAREVSFHYPHETMVMKLCTLDEVTGEFIAERVK